MELHRLDASDTTAGEAPAARRPALLLLADLPRAVGEESGFRVRSRFYLGEHFGFPRQTVVEQIVNVLRASSRRREIGKRKVVRYLETLLSLNSTRGLNDFDEMVRESGRRLEAEIRGMLNELRMAAEERLFRTEAARAAGQQAVKSRLERLEQLRAKVAAVSGPAANPSGHAAAP